jgi:3-phosphoshikimate 1-carboxyvinyltransferase
MVATIHPSSLKGNIEAPASKSSMQRALAAAWICKKPLTIFGPGHSADDKAAMEIIRSLGCRIEEGEDKLLIYPATENAAREINCGESGLSIRMFTPLVALGNQPVRITGTGSLVNRPMDFFDKVLPQLGVSIESREGHLPLLVKGPLKPANIEVDGSLSSQFLTGLIMAYVAAGANNVSIKVRDLKSKPYIALTLDLIHELGLAYVENRNFEEFVFSGSLPVKNEYYYRVEGDWSGGAFLLVAGAIAGPVTVRGLFLASSQADRALLDVMSLANASFAIDTKGIHVRPVKMNAFEFDATDCPDLFPPIVALAASCEGVTTVRGVDRLTHKESDRGKTLTEEFGKMGIRVVLDGNEMKIYGGALHGASLSSHHDHRIAMALAIAALKADGPSTIEGADAINKSYPDFFNDLEKLGANVSLSNKIKWHE